MTYRVAKNTTVDFEEQYTEAIIKEAGCSYIPYCSAVANGDITGIQIYQDVQPIQVKALWDFSSNTAEQWTGGAGWTFNTPANNWSAAASSASITQSSVIQPSGVYRVTFTISNYSAGTVTPQLGTVGGTGFSGNGTFTEVIETIDNSVGDFSLSGNAFTGNVDNICLEFLYYQSAFTNSASGWTTGGFNLLGGVMSHTSGGGTNPLEQDILSDGEVYKATVRITNHTTGTLTIESGLNEFGVIAENNNGTFTVYGIADGTTLELTPTDDLIADIEQIQVCKIYKDSQLAICDTDCGFIEFLGTTEYLEQINDVLAVQVDWESHVLDEANCYTLCYYDAEDNCLTESAILNAGLDDSSYWVLPTGTSIVGNNILVLAATAADARVRNVAQLCDGVKYRVQFTLNMSGGAGGEYVIVNAGNTASAPITSGANVDIEIISSGTTGEFNFQLNDDGGSMTIQALVVTAVIDEDTTPTACSNCFQFSDGGVYMTWNNSYGLETDPRDAFDFRYKTYPTYINSYRMDGKLQKPNYPSDISYNTNSARDFDVNVADVKTVKTLAGQKVPDWLVKSLAMAVLHNNFLIGSNKWLNTDGSVDITDLNCGMSNIEIELTQSGNKNVNECC